MNAASFFNTSFKNTDVSETRFYVEQICYVNFENAILRSTGFSAHHIKNVNFENACLVRASIAFFRIQASRRSKTNSKGKANTRRRKNKADSIRHTKHEEINLKNANLSFFNFYDNYFSIQDLEEVKTLYECRELDPEIEKALKATHPHLFKEPDT